MLANFVNLILCLACAVSAMCRLSQMPHGVQLRAAGLYLALFVVCLVSGAQFFLLGTFATWPDAAVAAVLLGLLLVSLPEWRNGPPAHLMRA